MQQHEIVYEVIVRTVCVSCDARSVSTAVK
jgi:hypothetical protein